jgi:hypothetical protein
MFNTTKEIGGSYIDQETNRFMIPIDKIEPYKDNPRYPYETDFDDSTFKSLVVSIFTSDCMNHTPIRVYYQNERWHLKDGHRRVEALKTINRILMQNWETLNDGSPKPTQLTHIYATKEPIPNNELEFRLDMLSQDATSSKWTEVKKFKFFSDTYDMFSDQMKSDRAKIQERTGLTRHRINDYLNYIATPVIKNTILESTRFPKGNIIAIANSCYYTSRAMQKSRPELVRNMTKFSPDSDKALNAVCSIVIKKAENLSVKRRLGQLSIGVNTALRNFYESIVNDADSTDDDIQKFLTSNTNMWLSKLVKNYSIVAEDSETRCYDTSIKLYKRPREKSEKQAMLDAIDYQRTADFWNEKALMERKYIENIRSK